MVFTLQDRTSDDFDLVWLEVLLKPYRGYRAAKECCILLRMVFTLQDQTLGDLELVWLETLLKPYRSYRAAISGKLCISGKIMSNNGWIGGRAVRRFCLSRSAIELRMTLT